MNKFEYKMKSSNPKLPRELLQKYERDDSEKLIVKEERPILKRSDSIQNLINIYESSKIIVDVSENIIPVYEPKKKSFVLNLEKYKQ